MHAITKKQSEAIGRELAEAAEQIFKRYGLAESPGSIRIQYGDHFKFAIVAARAELNEDGVNTEDPLYKNLVMIAPTYGIDLSVKGTIHYKGEEWIPVGYNTRAPKMPFILKHVITGNRMKYGEFIASYFPGYKRENDRHNDPVTMVPLS